MSEIANIIVDEKAEVVTAEVGVDVDGVFYSAVGTSKTAHPDKFDPEIGVKIATGRAIRQLGRNILKDGQDEVHRRDRVRQAQIEQSERAREIRAARGRAFPSPRDELLKAIFWNPQDGFTRIR